MVPKQTLHVYQTNSRGMGTFQRPQPYSPILFIKDHKKITAQKTRSGAR